MTTPTPDMSDKEKMEKAIELAHAWKENVGESPKFSTQREKDVDLLVSALLGMSSEATNLRAQLAKAEEVIRFYAEPPTFMSSDGGIEDEDGNILAFAPTKKTLIPGPEKARTYFAEALQRSEVATQKREDSKN